MGSLDRARLVRGDESVGMNTSPRPEVSVSSPRQSFGLLLMVILVVCLICAGVLPGRADAKTTASPLCLQNCPQSRHVNVGPLGMITKGAVYTPVDALGRPSRIKPVIFNIAATARISSIRWRHWESAATVGRGVFVCGSSGCQTKRARVFLRFFGIKRCGQREVYSRIAVRSVGAFGTRRWQQPAGWPPQPLACSMFSNS